MGTGDAVHVGYGIYEAMSAEEIARLAIASFTGDIPDDLVRALARTNLGPGFEAVGIRVFTERPELVERLSASDVSRALGQRRDGFVLALLRALNRLGGEHWDAGLDRKLAHMTERALGSYGLRDNPMVAIWLFRQAPELLEQVDRSVLETAFYSENGMSVWWDVGFWAYGRKDLPDRMDARHIYHRMTDGVDSILVDDILRPIELHPQQARNLVRGSLRTKLIKRLRVLASFPVGLGDLNIFSTLAQRGAVYELLGEEAEELLASSALSSARTHPLEFLEEIKGCNLPIFTEATYDALLDCLIGSDSGQVRTKAILVLPGMGQQVKAPEAERVSSPGPLERPATPVA